MAPCRRCSKARTPPRCWISGTRTRTRFPRVATGPNASSTRWSWETSSSSPCTHRYAPRAETLPSSSARSSTSAARPIRRFYGARTRCTATGTTETSWSETRRSRPSSIGKPLAPATPRLDLVLLNYWCDVYVGSGVSRDAHERVSSFTAARVEPDARRLLRRARGPPPTLVRLRTPTGTARRDRHAGARRTGPILDLNRAPRRGDIARRRTPEEMA